jgi:hypothetical protein
MNDSRSGPESLGLWQLLMTSETRTKNEPMKHLSVTVMDRKPGSGRRRAVAGCYPREGVLEIRTTHSQTNANMLSLAPSHAPDLGLFRDFLD